jgi:hypothetical protein
MEQALASAAATGGFAPRLTELRRLGLESIICSLCPSTWSPKWSYVVILSAHVFGQPTKRPPDRPATDGE